MRFIIYVISEKDANHLIFFLFWNKSIALRSIYVKYFQDLCKAEDMVTNLSLSGGFDPEIVNQRRRHMANVSTFPD